MKVFIAGLWHLGCVTAACLAKSGHEVVAYDPNKDTVRLLQNGEAPIYEPGLNELLNTEYKNGKLNYSETLQEALQAEVVWITFDTPVDDNDIADIGFVKDEIEAIFPYLQDNALVLISSQLPVGSTRELQQRFNQRCPNKKITFACIPENLRLGKAIEVFTNPDRIVVGLQDSHDQKKIQALLGQFTDNFIWVSIESAEMIKHALNAFLASSVVLINTLAKVCEQVGADVRQVELGLKSDERIGSKAYLRAGNAIAGGTLARDVNYLIKISEQYKLSTPLFSSILSSNQIHKQWSCEKLVEILKDFQNKKIAMLGLTYKAGTNTLRRSTAIETCQWLHSQGAKVIAHDPVIEELPQDFSKFIELKATIKDTLKDADAIVIATEWPEFTALNVEELIATVKQPYIIDPNGFLSKQFKQDKRVRYFSVGSQT